MTNLKSVKNSDKGALVTYTGDNGKEYNVIAHAKVTVDGVQHVFPANGTHEEQRAYFQLVADQAYANNVKMAERQANLTDEERAAQREAGLRGAAISKAKFDAMTDEQKAAYKEQQRQAGLKGAAVSKAKFDAMSDEDKAAYKAEQSRQGKAAWEAKTPEEKEAHRQQSIQNNIQNIIKVDDSFQL